MKRKFAFTLTEIMIAMGVIGIISAITVPTLVNNYTKKANATQIRKFAQEIATAADMYTTENSKTHLKHTGIYNSVGNANTFITSKFKVTKNCGASGSGCFADNYRSISNASSLEKFNCTGSISYVLTNGVAICARATNSGSNYVQFYVDINGTRAPNIGGRDMFMFYLRNDGDISGTIGTAYTCTSNKFGEGCFRDLELNNWVMNY